MKRVAILALALAVTFGVSSWSKKKDKDDPTQVLALPKDPPAGVVAETRRLVFHTSPLNSAGLLSKQTKDAVRALWRLAAGATTVKIRAFVAGSGDVRRVSQIISEMYSDKHQPLPAVSVIQTGALGVDGAQVVLEAVSEARKEVNRNGLLFISGQAARADHAMAPPLPLIQQSLEKLRHALMLAGSSAEGARRVTCFVSSLGNPRPIENEVATAFPQAAVNVIQVRREPLQSVAECEAVAELAQPQTAPLEFRNVPGADTAVKYSQIAAVASPRVALTGAQVAFGFQDSDARLAFQRLDRLLVSLGSSSHDVAMANFYPLSASISEQVRKIRFEFFDPNRPPASTLLPFEGLPSIDASFAVDVVAVARN